ncbi:alpha/beta hydrolase family protein [Alteromonas halophila]|uniref:Alpha/beta hydrolase n=1 Tax=Alteromonas halophila TaxID=516698 RepID=A0A918MXF2_9ALTE|nr:alpha/beta fold hydrolase [Alteromonas halophila]GGW78921.1 alpha/beta hydrolase [Alteromonas halophila]
MQRETAIRCEDGHLLAATLFIPDTVKAAVMVGPATGIRRQFYTHFATYLASQGFAVITYDNRGIGESLQGTVKDSDASLVCWGQKDMPAVFSELQAQVPDVPYFLVGHSAGGQLVGLMHNASDFTAMCNFGSSSGQLSNMRPGYLLPAHFFMNVYIPLNNLLFGHTKAHLVGMGEPLPKQVARQWQQWCNGQGYVQTAFGREVKSHFYDAIHFPSKWLIAEDDDIANLANVQDMLRVFPNMNAEVTLITPSEHGLTQVGHMGFFSRRCKSLWPIISDYLLSFVDGH